MVRNRGIYLTIFCFLLGIAAADWNILRQETEDGRVEISVRTYCESWRMNVELHNIRDFDVVPQECVSHIGHYMTSTQYQVDSQRAIQEALVYLSTSNLENDGKDAWIFDIDDTLLSTIHYYKKNGYGGNKLNSTSLEDWMRKRKGTALVHSLRLFNVLKEQGIKIILVSSRKEHLRHATVENLIKVGFCGWTSLILRGKDDECKTAERFKSEVRSQLFSNGYRLLGIVGDQWSSIEGLPYAERSFKLPNPLYYVA